MHYSLGWLAYLVSVNIEAVLRIVSSFQHIKEAWSL